GAASTGVGWSHPRGSSSTDLCQPTDPPRGDPFGNQNVAVVVEASVVRMNELAIDPLIGMAPHGAVLAHHLVVPFGAAAELRDDLVLFVEQGNTGFEIGDE